MPEQQNANRPAERMDEGAIRVHALPPLESRGPSPWLWLGVALLLIAALLVIFVLPVVVREYELPLEPRVEVVPPPPATAGPSADELSPYEEAVLARARSQAQEVLAAILEAQDELEALRVGEWAQAEYDSALEAARVGDAHYRDREFDQADARYREAAYILGGLIDSVPIRLGQALAAGEEALLRGDPARAAEQFNLALVLEPGDAAAATGLERTATHNELAALLERAGELAGAGDLQQSLAVYREAAALDPANPRAGEGIAAVSARIREREFSAHMSAGFALLDAGDPAGAIAEFASAEALGVNREQARSAIEQTRGQVASVEIERLRGRVEEAERGEQWQQAVAAYDQVLQIDANVVFAIDGRGYAARRAQLDNLLAEAIANPYRFNEDDVYRQALDVYYTGRAIENPGPKLAGQLDALEALLSDSQIPIDVPFASDNLTHVTLLRVAELGEFEQTSLMLKPGRYVALGRRIGYREVREEFTVGFGQTPGRVVVQCAERLGSRR